MNILVRHNCGDAIEDAARDMCVLATQLNVGVEADFNGTKLIAFPKGSALELVRQYQDPARKELKFAFNK